MESHLAPRFSVSSYVPVAVLRYCYAVMLLCQFARAWHAVLFSQLECILESLENERKNTFGHHSMIFTVVVYRSYAAYVNKYELIFQTKHSTSISDNSRCKADA